jgi:hypothetical protein
MGRPDQRASPQLEGMVAWDVERKRATRQAAEAQTEAAKRERALRRPLLPNDKPTVALAVLVAQAVVEAVAVPPAAVVGHCRRVRAGQRSCCAGNAAGGAGGRGLCGEAEVG